MLKLTISNNSTAIRKRFLKIILFILLLVLCLQNRITLDENAGQSLANVSHRVTFTTAVQYHTPELAQPVGVEGYEEMKMDEHFVLHPNMPAFMVSKEALVVAQNDDIESILGTQEANGFWYLHFLFTPEASQQIVKMSQHHVGGQFAIIFDQHLVSTPRLQKELSSFINAEGKYRLSIPTQFHSESQINAFIASIN